MKTLDTDHDGFISKEELNSAEQSIKDKCVNIENLNKYGKISLGEVLLAENGGNDLTKAYLESKYGKGYAQMLLNKYDNDGNGTITSKELETQYSNENNKSNGLSTGAIIGIIIGAVVLVGLIVGLIVYFSRKKKKSNSGEKEGNSCDKNNSNARYTTKSDKESNKSIV